MCSFIICVLPSGRNHQMSQILRALLGSIPTRVAVGCAKAWRPSFRPSCAQARFLGPRRHLRVYPRSRTRTPVVQGATANCQDLIDELAFTNSSPRVARWRWAESLAISPTVSCNSPGRPPSAPQQSARGSTAPERRVELHVLVHGGRVRPTILVRAVVTPLPSKYF